MSLTEINVTAVKVDDVLVTVEQPPPVELTASTDPTVQIIAAGNVGPMGPQGQWVSMTQAQYDALTVHDPKTLYVIV